jgi:hypothetical protein
LSFAIIIDRSSATSCLSSSTRSSFSFWPLSAHKEPQRGRLKSLRSTRSTPPLIGSLRCLASTRTGAEYCVWQVLNRGGIVGVAQAII